MHEKENERPIKNLVVGGYLEFNSNNYVDFSRGPIYAPVGVVYPLSVSMDNDNRIFDMSDSRSKEDRENSTKDLVYAIPITQEWVNAFGKFHIFGEYMVKIGKGYELTLNDNLISLNNNVITKVEYVHQLQSFYLHTFGKWLTLSIKQGQLLSNKLNKRIYV
jgi:hypothetical protein